MRAAVIILALAMSTMLSGCGQPTPGPQGPNGDTGAKGDAGPEGRLGRPGRKVYKALQDQPGPHHSSALSAHPARVLSHARLHVVRMKSLSLHFVGQKEPLQTISLRTLFHAGSIRTPPAALWSRSARSSRDAHASA